MRYIAFFFLSLVLIAATPAQEDDPCVCDAFPKTNASKQEVRRVCGVSGWLMGQPAADVEIDCFVIYSEGGRFFVEYHGRVIGKGYALPPDLRTGESGKEAVIIFGSFGSGLAEIILPIGRSIGTYDVNRIFDLGRGRFAYSNDYRHIAFIEQRENSSFMNVDGVRFPLPARVDEVSELRFDALGVFISLKYTSGEATYQRVFPTVPLPLVRLR